MQARQGAAINKMRIENWGIELLVRFQYVPVFVYNLPQNGFRENPSQRCCDAGETFLHWNSGDSRRGCFLGGIEYGYGTNVFFPGARRSGEFAGGRSDGRGSDKREG